MSSSRNPPTYSELVARQVARPIHDRAAYDNACEIVHSLVGFKLNRDQDDYLQLTAKLIEEYENEPLPEPASSLLRPPREPGQKAPR